MVHYKKFLYAVQRYIDTEIASIFPGSLKGGALSFAGFVLGNRGEKLFAQYKDNPMIRGLGLIDGENVDDELLIQFLRSKVQGGKVTLPVPLVGNMDFSLQDVDTFARLIRE
ncbi:MAG: hypothetical protein J6M10_10320 [Clostridia bacterium]|nr:hypothetical protein [Clostridia bacterium]